MSCRALKKWGDVIEFTQGPTVWGRFMGGDSLKKRKPHRALATQPCAWSFSSCDEGNKAIQLGSHSVVYDEARGAS